MAKKAHPEDLSESARDELYRILVERKGEHWADWKVSDPGEVTGNILLLKTVSPEDAVDRMENERCIKCGEDDIDNPPLCESCKESIDT